MAAQAHDGDLGTILAVFAHPDDEAYIAGGLMALAAQEGRRVVCVTATRGELGFPDDDPRSLDERAAVREAELDACLDVLGVREHHWLGHADGSCASLDPAVPVAQLRDLLDDVQPDTVITFGPDGQTFHPDHIAVCEWTTAAVTAQTTDTALLYATMATEWVERTSEHLPFDAISMRPGATPTTAPYAELDVVFFLDDELLDRKVRGLLCQQSQVAALVEAVGLDNYRDINRDETFSRPTAALWRS